VQEMGKSFKDRLINIRLRKDEKQTSSRFLITGAITLLLAVNLIYLNFVFFKNNKILVNDTKNNNPNSTISTVVSPAVFQISPSVTPAPQVNNVNIDNTKVAIKDYYIPLGSGSSQAGDWEDVSGALATIDFGQYQSIKEIKMEASVVVPTGNEMVWVRLFNKTDQHPVWYSEVAVISNANSYLVSSPVAYDFGKKIYQVQMKTQLKVPANLIYARIHVVSE
jgi:hypothetical protein